MKGGERKLRALLKLRAVARRQVTAAARTLAGLEQARGEAMRSLERLEAAIRTEETVALGRAEIGFRDFAAFLAGAAAKREALLQSCRSLDHEINGSREALHAAEIERRKFDHLVDQVAARRRANANKREVALLDEAGRRGRGSRGARG